MRSCKKASIERVTLERKEITTNEGGLRLVKWNHMPAELSVPELRAGLDYIPSLVHDDESNIPRGESISARAPHGADDLLRAFSDPRNGFHGQEFFLEHTFEFLQPSLVADVVANTVCTNRSVREATAFD